MSIMTAQSFDGVFVCRVSSRILGYINLIITTYYDSLFFTICHHSPFLVAARLFGLRFAFECAKSIYANQG